MARSADRVGPLRGHQRAAQLQLPARDQDRPGGQARRGRPPARHQGHRAGGAGAQRPRRHRPHQPLEQPRPLLDRGPGPADRGAQDRQPEGPRGGQAAGGAGDRHDRRRRGQGRRRHRHPVGLRRRHRRGSQPRPAARRPAGRDRSPRGSPGPAGIGPPREGRGLVRWRRQGRRRRHQDDPAGRQPLRLRDDVDGGHRLHHLPRLPAGHLPRRHRHPGHDPGGGRPQGHEALGAPRVRPRGHQPGQLFQRRRRGGQGADRGAGRDAHPGPGRALRPAGPVARARPDRPDRADHGHRRGLLDRGLLRARGADAPAAQPPDQGDRRDGGRANGAGPDRRRLRGRQGHLHGPRPGHLPLRASSREDG